MGQSAIGSSHLVHKFGCEQERSHWLPLGSPSHGDGSRLNHLLAAPERHRDCGRPCARPTGSSGAISATAGPMASPESRQRRPTTRPGRTERHWRVAESAWGTPRPWRVRRIAIRRAPPFVSCAHRSPSTVSSERISALRTGARLGSSRAGAGWGVFQSAAYPLWIPLVY